MALLESALISAIRRRAVASGGHLQDRFWMPVGVQCQGVPPHRVPDMAVTDRFYRSRLPVTGNSKQAHAVVNEPARLSMVPALRSARIIADASASTTADDLAAPLRGPATAVRHDVTFGCQCGGGARVHGGGFLE
jgi:hypothetical protein